MRTIILFVVFFSFSGFPQTFLTGELKGTYPKDTYIISGNIIVKSGDTLIFEAGSELRFQPMAGVRVEGVFIANGTKSNPIAGTSLQPVYISKEKWDESAAHWNGIAVMDTMASIRLSYVLLGDAVTAIDIKKNARDIFLDRVVFYKNGAAIVRRGRPMGVKDEMEYVYSGSAKDMIPFNDSVDLNKTAKISEGHLNLKQTSQRTWREPVRISLSLITLAGAGAWLSGRFFSEKYDNDYHAQRTAHGAISTRQKRDEMVLLQAIGMAICGAGSGFFSISFLF
jgi:hypothetical protein